MRILLRGVMGLMDNGGQGGLTGGDSVGAFLMLLSTIIPHKIQVNLHASTEHE